MAENKYLAKNLQATRKGVEQLSAEVQNTSFAHVYLEELKETILSEVSTMGETMQSLYEEFVTMHKEFFHLHGLQHKCKDDVKTLKVVQSTVASMHEWSTQYKWALLELGKKAREEVV